MQPDEMTQQQAVQRAIVAAERAEARAVGVPERASDWAAVAQAWAAVAGQLPLVDPRPAAQQQIAVPVPRPLRETDEQQAALDALHGRDPLDPRVPVDELDAPTAVIEVHAHEPISHASSSGVCRGCSQPIEWHGGVWVDISGGALCRTPSR
jgi:hypothetical protein